VVDRVAASDFHPSTGAPGAVAERGGRAAAGEPLLLDLGDAPYAAPHPDGGRLGRSESITIPAFKEALAGLVVPAVTVATAWVIPQEAAQGRLWAADRPRS
jgi:hypothetical protein